MDSRWYTKSILLCEFLAFNASATAFIAPLSGGKQHHVSLKWVVINPSERRVDCELSYEEKLIETNRDINWFVMPHVQMSFGLPTRCARKCLFGCWKQAIIHTVLFLWKNYSFYHGAYLMIQKMYVLTFCQKKIRCQRAWKWVQTLPCLDFYWGIRSSVNYWQRSITPPQHSLVPSQLCTPLSLIELFTASRAKYDSEVVQ